jgi:hypothetical protein
MGNSQIYCARQAVSRLVDTAPLQIVRSSCQKVFNSKLNHKYIENAWQQRSIWKK